MVMERSVRPWKARSKTTTAGRPVATRAILTAFSIASAPELSEQALLLVASAGRELGEAAADLDVRLVHPDHEALVEVAVDLLVDGRDRRRWPVAGVLAAEAAGEVDVRAAVDVLDARALGPGDDEGRSGHAGGDVALAGRDDGVGCAALPQSHAASLLPAPSDPPWPTRPNAGRYPRRRVRDVRGGSRLARRGSRRVGPGRRQRRLRQADRRARGDRVRLDHGAR